VPELLHTFILVMYVVLINYNEYAKYQNVQRNEYWKQCQTSSFHYNI